MRPDGGSSAGGVGGDAGATGAGVCVGVGCVGSARAGGLAGGGGVAPVVLCGRSAAGWTRRPSARACRVGGAGSSGWRTAGVAGCGLGFKVPGAQLPPPARRTAHRSPRLDPAALCRNGRPPLPAGQPASQKISSTIRRRLPPSGRRGWGVDALRRAQRAEPSPEWVRFSVGPWVTPYAAAQQPWGRWGRRNVRRRRSHGAGGMGSAPREALRGEEGAQGRRHTEGRSASPPEYPHGIWDKSAYFCHEPNRVLGQNSNRILLHPAPLLKPCSSAPNLGVAHGVSRHLPATEGRLHAQVRSDLTPT